MAIDFVKISTRVRFLLGGADERVIDTNTLNMIIQDCIDKYNDEDDKYCEALYCALMQTLRYLINRNLAEAGQAGNVKRRKEVNGKRSIDVEYSNSTDIVTDGWQKLYKHYLKHPGEVCSSLTGKRTGGLVIVGGVSESEYDRVNDNPDSRNAYKLSVRNRYDRKTSDQVRRKRWTTFLP